MRRDPGSFRDSNNRVYDDDSRILRGISAECAEHWSNLSKQEFYRSFQADRKVIATEATDPAILPDPWPAALSHQRVPFVSYPYEWPFGMLKDAALLHLDLLETAITNGWTLKDTSAYNIQWQGTHPVFIDLPSFEPHPEGDPWVGYRQFCMMFLNPLMLQAYRGIDYRPLLRSDLEGIDPTTANRVLTGFSRFRKGVLSNVYLHSRMQERAARKELGEARNLAEDTGGEVRAPRRIKHSQAMILGTLQGLARTISKLEPLGSESTWESYDSSHSYNDSSLSTKAEFVERCVRVRPRRLVWDLGCNTGMFSRICAEHADYVVSIDGDANAVERFYRREKSQHTENILPLVMDLANLSPDQGWRGSERRSLEGRGRPDLVLCLALVHHMVISANIPLQDYFGWLHDLRAEVVIEFVGLKDAMSQILLRNRVNQYEDLTMEQFEKYAEARFEIMDRESLKGGDRQIYYLRPR